MSESKYSLPHPVVEQVFESSGYRCVILFYSLGHRCGYVGLPKGHSCYGKGCDEVDIDCHGGLTYADGALFGTPDDALWWFGFDCAHAGDDTDFDAMARYYPESQRLTGLLRLLPEDGCVRTVEFVREQCAHIAEQLKAMETAPMLKPCPFCGSIAEVTAAYYRSDVDSEELVDYYVGCSNERCCVGTPWLKSEAEAVEVWNRRVDDAAY